MPNSENLTLRFPEILFSDQEDESETNDASCRKLTLIRNISHSPKKKTAICQRIRSHSDYSEDDGSSGKHRRPKFDLSTKNNLTQTFYGNVTESSHYRSVTTEYFKKKSLNDIEHTDVKRLLQELGIIPNIQSFHVRKADSFFGYYTAAIYDVYENIEVMDTVTGCTLSKYNLIYVVKFYDPETTTFDKIRNLIEIRSHPALHKKKRMIGLLPRLCFHKKLGDLSLANTNYYFSVLHAAQGELARDVFKSYASAPINEKFALQAKILKTIEVIGESIGSFHCHHALNDPSTHTSCLDYINGRSLSFETIIHKDLHPGNIFIDLSPTAKNTVTLIDMESMYISCIRRQSNIVELNYLKVKIAEILDVDSEPDFLTTLEKAYQYGMKKAYDFHFTRPTSPQTV